VALHSVLPHRERPAGASPEQFDGRGFAVWTGHRWKAHRSVGGAPEDAAFEDASSNTPGQVLLLHNRMRTLGRARLENTHPFCHDGWAFAHVGAVRDCEWIRSRCPARRVRQLGGETDSELLCAYLLGCIDVAGGARDEIDAALTCSVRELGRAFSVGGFTFLLSDGRALYAYRRGEPLFVLERRKVDGGVQMQRAAILVASAPLTDEAWTPIIEGDLIRVARDGSLSVRTLTNTLPPVARSGPELPFTD
jgi:glutamine amidotransferase